MSLTRRQFTAALAASMAPLSALAAPEYQGPNVILVRFGGGVRRAETIDEATTWAPYLRQVLARRGTFIPDLRIDKLQGVETGHAEGTVNLLTGRYLAYRQSGALSERLEPTEPTLFEYLRDAFAVPSHQVLLVNGEDRPQEEFMTFGMADHFGVDYRAEMLSLHRYKLFRTQAQLAEPLAEDTRAQVLDEQARLIAINAHSPLPDPSPEVTAFWTRWRETYGDTGLLNARGDRLLTELSLRAMAELKPRFLMVNYQDPDYVHWGNPSHYTRAIAVIDEGLKRLVEAADADPFYAGNTVFVITPDCGRDANALVDVPFQHHFNSASAHQVWAVLFGPGIGRGVIDRPVDQSSIAPTIAAAMGFRAHRAEGSVLDPIFV